MFGGDFAPLGWAFCDGSLLAIAQYPALFQLIGTTYGGDGQVSFALPDLRSRVPVHAGPGFVLGQASGSETVTLTVAELPVHSHTPAANNSLGTLPGPAGNVWAASPLDQYSSFTADTSMSGSAIGIAGGSLPHDNMLPFGVINFIVALSGVFPTQT